MSQDISQNTDLIEIKGILDSANSKLNEAKLNNNTQLADEISNDISVLNNKYAAAQLTIQQNNERDKQTSRDFLASQRRTAGDKRAAYEESIKGGLVNATDEQFKAYRDITSDQDITNNEIHTHLSRVLDVPKEKVDVETGLGAGIRAKLSLLQTPEEKLQYLQSQYKDGVERIDISGTPAFAMKKNDGSYVLADELGTSVNDFTSDIVGQVIPTAVGVGASIIAARTKVKNPSVFVNAAQSGAGFIQDVAARKALGLDANLGESVMSRGSEALIGFGIDQASRLLINPLAKRLGTPLKNELAKKVDQARTLLKQKGFDTTAPISYLFGARALDKEKQLIGRMEGSMLGTGPTRAVQKTVDELSRYKESITGVPPNIYGTAMDSLKTESDNLARLVADTDVNAGKVVSDVLNRRLNDIAVQSADKEVIGNSIRSQLVAAKEKLIQVKNAVYGDFYTRANSLTMTPGEVAQHLAEGSKSQSKEYQNSGIDKLVQGYQAREADRLMAISLRDDPNVIKIKSVRDRIERLSKSGASLSAADVDDVIKMAKETIPEGGSFATGNTHLPVAEGAAAQLRAVQRGRYADIGMDAEWDAATQAYDTALKSQRGLNGKILKTKLGEPTATATDVIDGTLSDPQHIREVIDLAGESSPQAASQMREDIKKAYLTKIGMVSNGSLKPDSLSFDEGIVKTLWGTDPAGVPNPAFGNRMVEKLQDLQKSFKDKKLNMSNIKVEDVNDLFVSLDDAQKLEIKKRIIDSSMAKQSQEDFANNELIKIAKKGDFDALDGDNFSKAMYSAKVSDVADIMRRIPASQKASLQGDFVAQLMRDHPSTTTTTGGKTIFDGAKFIKSLEGVEGKIIEGRIKAVMGKEFFDTFKAAATMAEVNHIPLQDLSGPAIKTSASADRIKFFGVGNILGYGSDRFMSGAHGLNILVPFWKAMAKDVGPIQTAKNFKNLYNTSISGRIGITAIAHAGRNDPDFKQNINDFLYGRAQDDSSYARKMNGNIPTESR